MKHFLLPFLFAAMALSHISFLKADADRNMVSGSRGALSDEGLNTAQIRNYIHSGNLNLTEGDNLLKTPLFSCLLLPVFTALGDELYVARSFVLIVNLILLFVIHKIVSNNFFTIALAASTLVFPPVHQHIHFCLAESISSMLIILSAALFAKNSDTTRQRHALYLLPIFAAILLKVQFLYLLFLPIASLMSPNHQEKFKRFRSDMKWVIIFVFVCAICWYLPFMHEWRDIMSMQSGSLSSNGSIGNAILVNLQSKFFNRGYSFFTILIIISIVALFCRWKKGVLHVNHRLMWFGMIWFMLECHKLVMGYLPVRYCISTFISGGFLIALFAWELKQIPNRRLHVIALTVIGLLFVYNLIGLNRIFVRQSFVTYEMNQYFKSRLHQGDFILGAWSPGLNWGSSTIAIPVMEGLVTDQPLMQHYKPRLVITEPDEDDANQAFSRRGIVLSDLADSIYTFQLGEWTINAYWIRNQDITQ
jgi:hypothetical protein